MATETATPPRAAIDRRELFKRLTGRRVELTTLCKTFDKKAGSIKEVFEDFLLFITVNEQGLSTESTRHWILFDVISVMTEAPKPATEESIEITR